MESEEKRKEFDNLLDQAWIQTRMEKDRSLLVLSAGGIGLLVTLLTTIGTRSIYEVVAYAFALFSFLVTVFSTIYIFGGNAKHIEEVKAGKESNDAFLDIIDKLAVTSFVVGIVFTVSLGIGYSISSMKRNQEVRTMIEEKNDSKTQVQSDRKSLSGIGNLQKPNQGQTGNNSSNAGESSSNSSSGEGNSKKE